MKCIVVDDEPLARQLIESYIEKVDGLHNIRSCTNALESFSFLQQHSVDLIFLDIQMPQITGIELLKSLNQRPKVILTTAFREYAVEAFDLDVIDYLLKPISFDRFLRSIGKIYQLKPPVQEIKSDPIARSFEEAYMYFKQDREMVKVYLKDIIYIESLKDYVRIKTTSGQIISYQKISYLEQKLPESKFIRIHRSYIIALDKVSSFTSQSIHVGDYDVPIGRNYKSSTQKVLNLKNILV